MRLISVVFEKITLTLQQSIKNIAMNKKLFTVLQAKCKDFGLTEKAIEDLAKTGSEGLTDETSDEDIEKKADSLVPLAKLMQAEVTRKAQQSPKPKTDPKGADGDGDGKGNSGNENEPDWFKKYREENDKKLSKLQEENETLKSERAKAERSAVISSTAKRLGIPDFMMKRLNIADDEDVEKALTEYKQELITNKLMPADSAAITSSSEQAAKDDAKTWAQSLPNN